MTRQGLPTGQMEQETQELLDEYNEEYCWEYNDMVDFIKEYGEKNFRDYYETYNRLCEDYGQNLVDEFAENFDIDSVDHFEDIYQGQYNSGAEFSEHRISVRINNGQNVDLWWERGFISVCPLH